MVNTRVYANLFANITYLFGSALSQAGQVVVARLMGGGNIQATRSSVKKALLGSVGVSLTVSVVLFIFARPAYSLFTKDPAVLALAQTVMLLEIPLEAGRAVNMVLCRALQACGDIRYPIVLCVIFAWVIGVGGSWLFGVTLGMGLAGLWLAMALDECIRAVLFLCRWHSGAWQGKAIL